MLLLFKACVRCQGELVSEEDEWKCIQCGDRHYPQAPAERTKNNKGPARFDANLEHKQAMDQRWWDRNTGIILMLDSGVSPNDIAAATGLAVRQIRTIRKQLRERREDHADRGE